MHHKFTKITALFMSWAPLALTAPSQVHAEECGNETTYLLKWSVGAPMLDNFIRRFPASPCIEVAKAALKVKAEAPDSGADSAFPHPKQVQTTTVKEPVPTPPLYTSFQNSGANSAFPTPKQVQTTTVKEPVPMSARYPSFQNPP